MRCEKQRTLAVILSILLMAAASSSANLSLQGGFVPFHTGSYWGATLGIKPVAGNFLVPEVTMAYAQGEAPVRPAPWPGSSYQKYDYSEWRDLCAVARLKLQGLVPNHPVYFALGVGAGPHLVGAKKDYWYDTNWHYEWQFHGHGFVQMNLRLAADLSIYTELEATRSFRRLQNPQKFPQGLWVLKFGLRFHPIGGR